MTTDADDVANRVMWNGVDATTGGYAFDASSMRNLVEMLGDHAERGAQDEERMRNLRAVTRSLPARVDPERLDQAGWGLVVRAGRESAAMDLLAPLIAQRRQQAGSLFRILTYAPGDSI